MARDGYVGLNNVARRLKKGYVGVNGVARRLKKGYLGVNGVARLCWVATQTWAQYEKQAVYVQNGPTQTSYSGSESGSMPNITTSSTYTFSADTGKFTLVNPTTSQHGGGSVNGYMIGGGYGKTGSVMRSSIYVAKRTSSGMNYYTLTATTEYTSTLSHYKAGALVGYVEGPEGSYPANGIQGDYYYILQK